MKRPQLKESEKAVIIALREMGLGYKTIAGKVGTTKTTVIRTLKTFESTGRIDRKKGSGRPRMSTESQDRVLHRNVLKSRFSSTSDMRREWRLTCSVDASKQTILRRLAERGIKARRPRKKPLLTRNMRQKRLEWAKRHRHWTEEDWRRVIFSDESKFNLHGSDGRNYVFRRDGEAYHPDCVKNTVKHPLSQMVWGCITSEGVGRLHFVNGTVNQNAYIDILELSLRGTISDQFGDTRSVIFQDDSAPCHRAAKVTEYKARLGIQSLEWPGNSPDLNPIENLWKLIGVKVSKNKPTNQRQLREAIIKAWHHDIESGHVKSLIDSMPQRCEAVIKARGGPTKY